MARDRERYASDRKSSELKFSMFRAHQQTGERQRLLLPQCWREWREPVHDNLDRPQSTRSGGLCVEAVGFRGALPTVPGASKQLLAKDSDRERLPTCCPLPRRGQRFPYLPDCSSCSAIPLSAVLLLKFWI